ncbi:Sodium-dependent dicarboxylate transporter SdcS [Poriferisphaera corsica]|uniref:Sodium-dependent dicarboxylate transporter SdcS n=1 Tax=Poriferisphaera corsica TaxID=2528020 RepID=A0A517YXK2_9BACT|nr:SLC13 family permease [Poriferisphaera corsica]QDU34941.1 Sodium-dependent dicarboxylate transporter SdcS [Poriferisphaera corsica]
MTWEAWFVVGVIIAVLIALVRNFAPADLLLLSGLTLVMVMGGLSGSEMLPSVQQAVSGFGNPGMLTVGVLFVVVEGLAQTGAMARITGPLLGLPKSAISAQARLIFPVAGMSAFLNNTPIVAMFMPVIDEWCKKVKINPSKLYIPLSYASIFGGACTLIGTSTNLIVYGMMTEHEGLPTLGMFDLAWVGVPCAVLGLGYILLTGRWMLPDRVPAVSLNDDPRQYTAEMIVEDGGAMIGKTIMQAGLRHLSGLYLAEIDRGNRLMCAVSSNVVLEANDRLIFVGVVESVVELRKMRGLVPATDQVFKLGHEVSERKLIEAVVSNQCPMIGKTIRDAKFRTNYGAAVIAVGRSGERIEQKIGDIKLQPGDTLLLEGTQAFVDLQRNSRDFFLVSALEGSTPVRHHRAWVAIGILGGMIAMVTMGWLSMLTSALLAAGLMIATRCCTGSEARRSVNWQVLLTIGAALGLGMALRESGAAAVISNKIIGLVGENPVLVLGAVYFVTMLFTEVITNNAAAVLVFPIAYAAAGTLGVSFMPFAIVIMLAASASFATPIGYQTNLMVYGPGGYRFTDYMRYGIPLNLLFMTTSIVITPIVWPF